MYFILIKRRLYLTKQRNSTCDIPREKKGKIKFYSLSQILYRLSNVDSKLGLKTPCWTKCYIKCPARKKAIKIMDDFFEED
jgi:hypothetical protein